MPLARVVRLIIEHNISVCHNQNFLAKHGMPLARVDRLLIEQNMYVCQI
jgi:hypothetical protein